MSDHSIDWSDLAGLERVVSIYAIGDNALVVETSDGREVRITARRDLRTARYTADFERRGTLRSGGQEFHVWAHTTAYGHCEDDGLQACLEAAVLEVDRLHLY